MVLPSSRALLAAGAALGVGLVALALLLQHRFGMEPCPWCILQRIIFLAMSLACLIGLAWRPVVGALLALALAACGIAAALWQHFVAAASPSCNFTFADKVIGAMKLDSFWPDVFSPRASCADAAVKLLGLPFEFWSLAGYGVLAAAMVRVLRQRQG